MDNQATLSNNENTMHSSTFTLPFSHCNVLLVEVCSLTSVYFSTLVAQQGVWDLTLASITHSHIAKDPTPTLICNLSNCWHLKLNPQPTKATRGTVTDYCRLWNKTLSSAVYASSLYRSAYICTSAANLMVDGKAPMKGSCLKVPVYFNSYQKHNILKHIKR